MVKTTRWLAATFTVLALALSALVPVAAIGETPESLFDATPTAFARAEDLLTLAFRLSDYYDTGLVLDSVRNEIAFPDDGTVSRKDAVRLLYAALGDNGLAPINELYSVTGLPSDDPAFPAVCAFLRAGVIADDPNAPFDGASALSETEMHVILSRIVFENRRETISFSLPAPRQAYLLCYTDNMDGQKEGIESGWEYDNRAGALKTAMGGNQTISDFKTDERSRFVRYLNKIRGDKIELFTWMTISNEFDGASLEYRDENDGIVYKLVGHNNKWCIENADGTYTELRNGGVGYYVFRITVDLASGVSHTAIGNVDYGEHPLRSDNVNYFAVCTGVENCNAITLNGCYMYGNYAVYEDFSVNESQKPYDMTTTGSVSFANNTVSIGPSASVSRTFDPIGNVVSFNWNTFLATGHSGMKYALMSGDDELVRITTQAGRFYANGVDLGKTFSDKLWWKLRIEADFASQKADIKVNAQVLATVDFLNPAGFADGIKFENYGNSAVTVDDIKVYNLVDYDIPAPVKPAGEENYVIGMNICSLWINGEHWGWSCVTPFDDIKPVLGYYDEGLPESADWENKFMAEHGIDFQAFCWYANQSNAPMKNTRLGSQLDEGYLHSKYQKDVKFALLWEASNASRPSTEQAFYDYYVNYWMENYFSNPNYIVLDNGGNGVLFMGVFGADKLVSTFGGADSNGEIVLKRMWDTLDQRVRDELGYDGVIVSVSNAGGNTWAKYGFDAWNAYNWGTSGYSLETNKSRNLSAQRSRDVYNIPTISVGFNHIGWAPDDRFPLMSVYDYNEAHRWVRDEYLPTYAENDNIPWNDNFVWLSTWNEYGEGTYIMPSDGLNGFGYLDVLRNVYSDGGLHDDLVPNEEQKARITHNYPQDRRLLRAFGNYTVPTVTTNLPKTVFSFTTGGDAYADYFTPSNYNSGASGAVTADGTVFTSHATNPDIIFNLKNDLWSDFTCEDIKAIRVVASGIPEGNTMQLFYRTTAAPTLSEANSMRITSATDGEQEFVFDFTGNEKWSGNINGLRLDPLQATNVTFTFKSITLELSDNYKVFTDFTDLYVNGVMLPTHIRGVVDQNGVAYYPFEPGRNLINFYLYVYFDWDYDTGVLNLYRDGKTVTFTVGSDVVTVDGEPMQMEGAVFQTDNIPMIPVKDLAKALGFRCVKNGKNYNFETPEVAFFAGVLKPVTIGNWTFDRVGFAQGWGNGNMSVFASDTCLRLTSSSSTDPVIRSVDNLGLSCDDYPYIEVKCRGKANGKSYMDLGFYFTTTDQTTETQSKYVGTRVPNTLDSGEWQTVLLTMSSNSLWTGTLKQLRFDPFNATGTIEVAYIRLLDAGGNPIPEIEQGEGTVFTIPNGDAEDASVGVGDFYSGNATISVVTDPTDSSNHCFLVQTNQTGQAWTYFRYDTRFTPGATYHVEFDAMVAGCGAPSQNLTLDGNTRCEIYCNFRYADTNVDHNTSHISLKKNDGWVHLSGDFTVAANSPSRLQDQFAIYGNPVNGHALSYYLDNITVTETLPE